MEKIYRVKMFNTSSSLIGNIAILCSKSNGGVGGKLTIQEIIGYIECEKMLYPATNDDISVVNLTEYHFIVFRGEKPAIEVMEMEVFNEVPTLDVYDQSKN